MIFKTRSIDISKWLNGLVDHIGVDARLLVLLDDFFGSLDILVVSGVLLHGFGKWRNQGLWLLGGRGRLSRCCWLGSVSIWGWFLALQLFWFRFLWLAILWGGTWL